MASFLPEELDMHLHIFRRNAMTLAKYTTELDLGKDQEKNTQQN